MTGREVWLKAENLQRTGSFKIRGAVNCIASLSDEERAAESSPSAGNHAQAVAWAAQAGIDATIFMPQDLGHPKVEATQNYGARIELGGEMFDDAQEHARAYAETSGATFVHPFEDERVIANQGTIGLELVEQLPDVGTVVVPIGGGESIGHRDRCEGAEADHRIVGVQAAACAPFAGGVSHGFTIAEGIAVKHPGELTLSIVRDLLDDGHGHRRGDQSGDRALARARGCWSRAPARRSPPSLRIASAARGPSRCSCRAGISTLRC